MERNFVVFKGKVESTKVANGGSFGCPQKKCRQRIMILSSIFSSFLLNFHLFTLTFKFRSEL